MLTTYRACVRHNTDTCHCQVRVAMAIDPRDFNAERKCLDVDCNRGRMNSHDKEAGMFFSDFAFEARVRLGSIRPAFRILERGSFAPCAR